VATDGEGAIWEANTGKKVVSLPTSGSAEFQDWSPDGRRVVASADDGVISFWSSSDGRLLASVYVLESASDWLLVTPDGRVDGSDRALTQMVAWRVGNRVVSDRALTQARRVPNLWSSIVTQSGH
jgi:WD40 repeat protein